MAHYTKWNQETIAQLLQQEYGIEGVNDFKVLSGGSQNTNYWVKTSNASFVHVIPEMAEHYRAMQDLAEAVKGLKEAFWIV